MLVTIVKQGDEGGMTFTGGGSTDDAMDLEEED